MPSGNPGIKKGPRSLELRKKLSFLMKKNYQNGHKNWNAGKKWSEEIRKKISESNKGKKGPVMSEDGLRRLRESKLGSKNPAWKGGIPDSFYSREKQRRKRSAGKHTWQNWQELKQKFNNMCLCCKRKEPEIKLTEDHIVPLSKGGSNLIDNIQPLCMDCNRKKFTKTINFIVTIEI